MEPEPTKAADFRQAAMRFQQATILSKNLRLTTRAQKAPKVKRTRPAMQGTMMYALLLGVPVPASKG